MKILHVMPYVEARYGGPPLALEQIVRASANAGIHCDLATVCAQDVKTTEVERAFETAGGRVCRFTGAWSQSWFFAPKLSAWLERCVKQYDLLHLHVPFTYPLMAAARHARIAGTPYVIMPHGVLDPWSLSYKPLKKRIYYALFEKNHLDNCAGINATSTLEQTGLATLGYARKTSITTLCVDTPPSNGPIAQHGGPLKLLFLSRLHPVKDLPTLLTALQIVNRDRVCAVLELAGSGDVRHVERIEAMIDALGLRPCVTLRGFLDGAAKRAAFAAADLFVLPSLHENFGMAVAEALAASLPVVVTDQVGIAPEIVAAQAGVAVPAGRPDLLAGAILSLQDPSIRKARGQAARKLAEQQFSIHQLTDDLQKFYARALDRGAPAA